MAGARRPSTLSRQKRGPWRLLFRTSAGHVSRDATQPCVPSASPRDYCARNLQSRDPAEQELHSTVFGAGTVLSRKTNIGCQHGFSRLERYLLHATTPPNSRTFAPRIGGTRLRPPPW